MLALLLAISLPVMAQEEQAQEQAQQQPVQGEIVAEVNGQEITMGELEQQANTQQLIMQLFQTDQVFAQLLYSTEAGQNLLDEYRKRKLDGLVEQRLLQQKAEKEGIELTDEEKEEYFQNHIEQLKAQNNISEEELVSALQQQGIESLEDYRQLFLENSNIVINKLLEKDVFDNIEVTEEEAKEEYDKRKEEGNYEEKSFEDVKDQIINELKQQKQQQAQQEYINSLKEEADIEKKL